MNDLEKALHIQKLNKKKRKPKKKKKSKKKKRNIPRKLFKPVMTDLEISNKEGLMAYKHNGFWQCADTIRELELLEKAIIENKYAESFNIL